MWSNGAVVVIKRGDAALADVIEDGCKPAGKHVKKTTVQDIKNMERDYNIMLVSHNEKIKKAMAESKQKYRKKPRRMPKPERYFLIAYGMVVYVTYEAWQFLAKKTKRIVKILGRSKYKLRRDYHV